MGRFGEIGQDMDNNHFRILSTIEGPGLKDMTETVPIGVPEQTLGIPEEDSDYDLPPFIPLVGRTPLEKLSPTKLKEEGPSGYGYLYRSGSREDMARWKKNRSPRLEANPDAILSQKEELKWYFEKQLKERGPGYVKELDSFVDQNDVLKHLNKDTKIAVCMPVAAPQEYDKIYNSLSLYYQQDKNKFFRYIKHIRYISSIIL